MAHIENPLTMFLRDIPRRQNGQPFESWEEFESWFRQERPKHAQIRIMVVLMTVLRWQESYHGTVVPDYMMDMMGPERFVHFLNPAHYFQFMSRETEFGTQNEIVNFSRLFRMRVRVADVGRCSFDLTSISLNRTIDSTDEPNIEWPWFALRFSGESLDGLGGHYEPFVDLRDINGLPEVTVGSTEQVPPTSSGCVPCMSPSAPTSRARYSFVKQRLLSSSEEEEEAYIASPPMSPVRLFDKRLYNELVAVAAAAAALTISPPQQERPPSIDDLDSTANQHGGIEQNIEVKTNSTRRLSHAEKKKQAAKKKAEAMKLRRADEQTRKKEKIRDAAAKRRLRNDDSFRETEAERDTARKRAKRLDEERRQEEAARDRDARRAARLDEERRQQYAAINRNAMRATRLDEERRQEEAARDRDARRATRLDEERRQEEAARDRDARRAARLDEERRQEEAARDRNARRATRQDPSARQREHELRVLREGDRDPFPVMEAEFKRRDLHTSVAAAGSFGSRRP
ncbi:Reticulocyte-binding protein 2-like protein a [Frankliniella fusca]|uniref:Reticulocyte-binding protein 2-like protein a n=1 Tax=Frankliniella fusca TaxID=407009 RepID=A0AAE1LP54_9NEOP|nr:Reticulocyte-binding protein 2-like protein a [Frankliniella fusca]